MILLTFRAFDGLRLGVKTAMGVVDVRGAVEEVGTLGEEGVPQSMEGLLAGGREALEGLGRFVARAVERGRSAPYFLDEGGLELGPCVPRPGKILCVGLNYRRHAAESGHQVPETPVLFSKFHNAVAAAGEPIPLPPHVQQYDYEAELAAVIGRRARYVGEERALEHVFGYCNGNDLSARELQSRTSQWLLGKTLDKFMPIGPYLVTADEVDDPQALDVRCWVNGELRQNSNTADMIFPVARLVSYISQYMTLEPGDVILTGTPEGVILGRKEKVWLKPGDEVVVEVGNLGRLTNVMCIDRSIPEPFSKPHKRACH